MDTMENRKMGILLKELEGIYQKIKKSDVNNNPFPYILIENAFDITSDDLFSNIIREEDKRSSYLGRNEYDIKLKNWPDPNNILDKIKNIIIEKFKLDININKNDLVKTVNAFSANFWEDSNELDIQDIHLDYLLRDAPSGYMQNITTEENQTVFSLHMYLPDDNEHIDLGTSIYSIKDDISESDKENLLIQADYPLNIKTLINSNNPLVKECMNLEFKVPFKHGIVYIHPTTPKSWHSAPKVPNGYIRKSLMLRWSWTEYIPKT